MTPGEDDPGRSRGLLRALLGGLGPPGEDLSQRVVHGGVWTFLQKAATRAVGLLKVVVLARLLAPEDFGLFGIALLTQATLDILLRFGVDEALIQRADDTGDLLDAAWTVKVVKAVVVAACLLVTAPQVAAFFDAPGATPLIRVLSAVVLMEGLENIGVVHFRRDLEFRKDFVLEFTSTTVNALVAVSLAVVLGSVWALMAGIAAGAAGRLVLSYALHPHRPRLDTNRRKMGELWGFGKWLFGSSTLAFASTQVDDVLIGRWLGAGSLGVYQVAYRISNTAATEVTHVISRVTFPAYSRLQSDPERLGRGFVSTLSVTTLIAVPLAGAIVLFIPDFVRHVIGEKWSAAIGPVRILAAAGLVRALSACWGPLYLARGRTEKPFWKQMLRAVLTLGPAYPLTMSYGLEGMSLCVLIGIVGAFAYDLVWADVGGAAPIALRALGRIVFAPAFATAAAGGLVLLFGWVAGGGLAAFLTLAAGYVLAYLLLLAGLDAWGYESGLGRLVSVLRGAGETA